MKKMNFINGFLLVLIICVSLIGISGVVYQKVVLDKKTESTNDTSRLTDVDTNTNTNTNTDTDTVDNGDGTHTHTYTDENGETVTETHSNDEHESENYKDGEENTENN